MVCDYAGLYNNVCVDISGWGNFRRQNPHCISPVAAYICNEYKAFMMTTRTSLPKWTNKHANCVYTYIYISHNGCIYVYNIFTLDKKRASFAYKYTYLYTHCSSTYSYLHDAFLYGGNYEFKYWLWKFN